MHRIVLPIGIVFTVPRVPMGYSSTITDTIVTGDGTTLGLVRVPFARSIRKVAMITEEVARSIESSVLCWLATVSEDGTPNVSPKEAFLHDGNGRILVAHIASPQTVRNIENNPRVCISFINVFTQVGHKIKGTARVLGESEPRYAEQSSRLNSLVGDTFRVLSLIEVEPTEIEEIVAPSYHLVPGTTAREMIQQSLKTYNVVEYQQKAARTGPGDS